MTPQELELMGQFIEKEFGIQMPETKRALLQSRLAKRLAIYGMKSYRSYFDFVMGPRGKSEFLVFTDLVSTHETTFFREMKHFKILDSAILPVLIPFTKRKVEILSAACSSGEEAYSLAFSLANFIETQPCHFDDFCVEGIDLSLKMVDMASRGIYPNQRLRTVPAHLCQKYFMHGKDTQLEFHRVVPELRRHMIFHTGNLLGEAQFTKAAYDLIFCRNVLIYFNRDNQTAVVRQLVERLAPGGYLFLGHSETMVGSLLNLEAPYHAVYRRAS